MDLQSATILARKYLKLLEPACEKIMIVGSTRRADEKAMTEGVHDIELLLIPKLVTPNDLFGSPIAAQAINKLDELLTLLKQQGLIADPQIARKANGPRYKKFALPGYNYVDVKDFGKQKEFCLELFIVTPETWGIQAVIRTGPSEFSYSFVNNESFVGYHKASGKRLRGLLPNYYLYIEGETKIIVRSTRNREHPDLEQVIDLATEEAAIKLLGLNQADNYWIEPADRYRYIKEEK